MMQVVRLFFRVPHLFRFPRIEIPKILLFNWGTQLTVILMLALSASAFAAENVQTGRYSELTTTATPAQLWPLANVVSVRYTPQTRVSDAVVNVLHQAGYQLHPNVWADRSIARLLNLPIPSVHHTFDEMAIQEVVHALIGASIDVLVDPVKRYVSFAPTHSGTNQ